MFQTDDVLARARAFLGKKAPAHEMRAEPVQLELPRGTPAACEPIVKTIWGSPAGKKRLAARLVKLIPTHKVYVEPFAGSGAVFFEKEPADVEVLSDADPEIASAYRALKGLSDRELEVLRRKNWVGNERTFKSVFDAKPRSKLEKLYRFLYVSHFSYGKLRGRSFNPTADGVEATTLDRIDKFRDRLKSATIRGGDYAAVVKEFDGKDTFFFLDPPYPGHDVDVGEDSFDEACFRKVLEGIKGRFLVTYGTRGQLDTKGFHVRKIQTPRSIRSMRGVGGPKTLPQLLIANYAITEKVLGGGEESLVLDEVEGEIELADGVAADLEHARALVKAIATEKDEAYLVELERAIDRIDACDDERVAVLARELLPIGERLAAAFENVVPALADALRDAVPALENVAKAKRVPFQQWGGSAQYAKRLVERLPEHKRYVEPFCGSAAVFYAKAPAAEEVLADADPDVVFAHRYLQKLDAASQAALKRLNWKVSRAGFERARACEPKSDAERFWKHAYGRLCTWGAKPNMSGYATVHDGMSYDLEDLSRFTERLKGVRLVNQDWKKTLEECDGAGTLFFIDPPYDQEWSIEDGITPEAVAEVVAKLKGDFLIAYTDSARARKALKKVGRPFAMRVSEGRGAGLWQKRSRLFVASFEVKKSEDIEEVDAEAAPASAQSERLTVALNKRIPLLKTGEERYVLGIVLEPETVDAQQDIYSAAEVREAAHRFMEDFRNVGLMHREIVNGQVKILESYVAPADFDLDGTRVKRGTWLLAVHVLDDALWSQVKAGELGGFSIGGSALRSPGA